MKKIKLEEWCWWSIDSSKTTKAYDDKLEFCGWFYWGGWQGLVFLEVD